MSTAPRLFTEISQMLKLKNQIFAKLGRIDNIPVSVCYVSKSTISQRVHAGKGITHYRRPKERLTTIAKRNTPNNNINPS